MRRLFGGTVLAFISGVTGLAFDPLITAAPVAVDVHERQAPGSNFLGYTSSGDGFGIATCNSGDYYTTSSRWGGCVDGVRHLAIGCTKTSMVIYDATTVTCPSSIPVCDTVMAYANPDKTTGLSVIRCFGPNTAKEAYYRDTSTSSSAASTTANSIATTQPSDSASDSVVTSIETSVVDVTNTLGVTETAKSSSATSTGSPSSDTTGGGKTGGGQKSLAWIAGPVVGGVAGIAIIALLIWIGMLLRKRSEERRAANTVHHEANMADKRASEAYSSSYPTPVSQPGRVVSAELSADHMSPQLAELQAAQYKQSAGHRYGAELE